MLISEAFASYCVEEIMLKNGAEKTVKNYRSALNSLTRAVTDIPVNLLTREHVALWNKYQDYLGHSPNTVAHNLSRLKQVLKYLKKRGMNVMDYDIIDLPKLRRSPVTYLIPKEVERLVSVIERPRDRAIFAMMFDSGARISELLNIDKKDLRDNSACIVGKGGKVGTLHFSEWSMNYLNQYLETRTDNLGPLFISGQCKRITVSRVQQLLHIYTQLAGIEKHVTPHVLRHSFATDMLRNGASIFDIKEQLRHERISSTEIYLHVEEEDKKRVYAQFHSKLR